MNLFTETLAQYLKEEWARVMAASEGVKEARFVVESLDPYSTFKLFNELENYRIESLARGQMECHFRVAKNLWIAWCQCEGEAALIKAMQELGGISSDGELKWIDLDDRLTWYRNLTLPANKDGLVVVLLGFNHATDQGGLANFHLVDEPKLWREMGECFYQWIQNIDQRYCLNATEQEIEYFDRVLSLLFKVRPRRLVRLAEFFENEVFNQNTHFDSMSEVIERCYRLLPFWDLPPLLGVKNTKEHANLIKEAQIFISHQRFKSSVDQNKAWGKIEGKLSDVGDDFEIPETLSSRPLYQDLQDFKNTLHDFIFKADAVAKTKLMQTNLVPVLEILKLPTEKKPPKDKIQRLFGASFDVILQSIWMTLLEFESQNGRGALANNINKIEIVIDRFNHDLDAISEEGNPKGLAKDLLNGCLGGLAELLEQIDLRMTNDVDYTYSWREQWVYLKTISISFSLDSVSYGTSRARPHVSFYVKILADEEIRIFKPRNFQWAFGPTHAERVRFFCARYALDNCTNNCNGSGVLPVFQMPTDVMTALYFAADEEEANRLVMQALSQMQVIDLMADITIGIDHLLLEDVRNLNKAYREWLSCFIDSGYYVADRRAHV